VVSDERLRPNSNIYMKHIFPVYVRAQVRHQSIK